MHTDDLFSLCRMHRPYGDGRKNRPEVVAYVVVVFMVLHPVLLCVADIATRKAGGMGWWGVPLNLLNLRMLYAVSVTIKAAREENNFESARNTKKVAGDVKLFETIFESLPQLIAQLIVLMHYKQCVNPTTAYVSLAVTVASITLALGAKFNHVYDLSENMFEEVFVALYFTADTISRSVAISMVFGA